MASIHRHYGGWRVQIRKLHFSPISKTFPLKKVAQLWARETERAIDLGRYRPPKETASTLGNVLQRYLKEVTPLKKGRDVEGYRIRKILRHAISKLSVCHLRSSDIASYRDSRIIEASEGTVRKELQLLSHAIDVAMIEWGEPFPTNPVKLVRKPIEGAGRERRLEKNVFSMLDVEYPSGTS
jgi:hypothetical protein